MTEITLATETLAGLKAARIDFVASLPSSAFTTVLPVVADDPEFLHVEVTNESDGVSICAGARLGGKRPVLMAENSGLLMGTYALACLENFGGIPFLMVLDHRGDFGEGDGYWYFPTGKVIVPTLDMLGIPYTVVRDTADVRQAIIDGARTVEASRRPAAVLLGHGVE
jgi:sulfopyruvate decarboxylase alpha subunit